MRRRLILWVLRLFMNERGGLSLGGPTTNSLGDIYNTINSGGGVPGTPLNSVQINVNSDFKGYANLRFITGTGLLIGTDVKVYFNANGGAQDVYLVHNSTNDYLELYTD